MLDDLPNSGPDEDDSFQKRDAKTTSNISSRTLLADAALATVLTKRVLARLADPTPRLTIIDAPGVDWCPVLSRQIVRSHSSRILVRTITEPKKPGSRFEATQDEILDGLAGGRGGVIVTHDPNNLLSAPLLAAADDILTISPDIAGLVKTAVQALTGKAMRGQLPPGIADLSFAQIAGALRPGCSVKDCLSNLDRAMAAMADAPQDQAGPTLTDIPLTTPVRTWANETLALLQDIDAGAVPPADAQFAVLEGPPGTGKTLIASALANSVGWTFVPTSVSSWFSASSGHLGGVSKAMAEFFDSLVAGDRVLGLLDEIDAIPNRTDLAPQDREWWTPVVTGLLLQIDRLRKSGRKVMLLGATNYYDRLDGALTRGGRLERRIPVLPPQTTAETRNIFAHYLGGQIADEDLDLAARLGRGATHAAIESWSRGAKIKARAEKRPMLAQDLIDQIAPPDNRSIEDLKCTALHEAGHALVSVRLGFEVTHMSLLRSGDADGLTSIEFEGSPKTWSRIQDMITALLAGRAADTALGRGPDSGAGRDLAMATNLLAKAIDRWGLGDALIVSAPQVGRVQIPPHLATKIDSELKAALRRASEMIASEVETVNILADRLTTQRVLSQLEILSIVGSSRQHAKLLPAERISPSH